MKAAGLATAAARGTGTGVGARAPFDGAHVWSVNKVLMSGLGLGFLQSWCCQFKLPRPSDKYFSTQYGTFHDTQYDSYSAELNKLIPSYQQTSAT